MKVVIIGAGQLGSRHLQALRNIKFDLDITVSDPSVESLRVAKERYESLPEAGKHKITFSEGAPKSEKFDLAIVATNAGHRRKVLEGLAQDNQVSNYVIEKILFTRLQDYTWAKGLTDSAFKNAWVNCCMRQMPVYKDIKSNLATNEFSMQVSGSNYGLITNAIHYIDYAAWLAGTTDYQLDTTALAATVVPSKRKGYLELNGSLRAKFTTGAVAQITCFTEGTLPVIVEVHSADKRYMVFESERKYTSSVAANAWKREELDAFIPFQSQLTSETVENIYNGKAISLPKLNESLEIHLNLLNPLKDFLTKTSQTQTDEFPFT